MSIDPRPAWRRRPVRFAVVVLAVVVTAASVIVATGRVQGERSAAEAASPKVSAPTPLQSPVSRSTLLVIGDSFAGGVGDPSFDVYPQDLAALTGWHVVVDAQGSTGFENPGRANTSGMRTSAFIDRLDTDRRRYSADFILVDGGRNDLGTDPAQVSAAISHYFDELHNAFPRARIAVVIPTYVTLTPAVNYPGIRDALATAASKVGADVMDPVAENWYAGVDLNSLLWNDGVHFNGNGNKFYATQIARRLHDFGYPTEAGTQ